MWIRNEEDLRAHLDDAASREGLAVDYKKDVDQNRKKGIAADVVETVCAMANADGGQVLVGVDEVDGAPTEVCGVASADGAQKWIEAAMDSVLRLAEPRPRVWVLEFDGKSVVIVDVHPSVRLASIWRPAERNKIMFPVRTGQGTAYMRPGDVEARILAYGPRAKRIMLEQLLVDRGESKQVALFHTIWRARGNNSPAYEVKRLRHTRGHVKAFEEFGVRLAVGPGKSATGTLWIPYDWATPFFVGVDEEDPGSPVDAVALLVRATIVTPSSASPRRYGLTPVP